MSVSNGSPGLDRIGMRDATERVWGTIPLTLDHTLPEMTHAAVARSSVPHAYIERIDASAARSAPGVLSVLTGADLTAAADLTPTFGESRKDQPILAVDKVRYVGDPVALVVATERRLARAAADMIEMRYRELPNVTEPVAAGAHDAPQVHDEYPRNECGNWFLHHGDVDLAWDQCDAIYEDTYWSPPASHQPMEPHVSVASIEGDTIQVWTAAQAPYMVRGNLAHIFGIQPEQVRVRVLNLGGGYGSKGGTKIEPLTAVAAHFVGKPVRLELSREEVFKTIGKHAAQVWLKTGVRSDGTVLVRDMDVAYNAGAYAVSSPKATGQALVRAPGPYATPHVRIRACARYTNTVPTGPFRGAMTSQLCWAYESQMDDIAADLRLDPVELRRKNLLVDGSVFATGEQMHDMHYEVLLDSVSDFLQQRRELAPRTTEGARGYGLGVMIKSTMTPTRSEARVVLGKDGIELRTSSVEMGQGAHATLLAITSEAMGLDPEHVRLPTPDTFESPFDTTTASSRTTYSMGTAVQHAAEHLKAQISEIAAKEYGCTPDDITHADGKAWSPDGLAQSYGQVRGIAGGDLEGFGVFQSEGGSDTLDENGQGIATPHWHQGAVGAEVEVDRETGKVTVLALHGAAYAGRIVSEVRVRQQLEGGMIWGLGPTLFEELHYDDGQLTNPNLSDYLIPSIVDIPLEISSHAVQSTEPDADFHGVGEMSVPAVSPAIGNAIYNALGLRVRHLPITAERVLRDLEQPDAIETSRTKKVP